MDAKIEALAQVRQHAQDAQRRARLATDPELKRHWQTVADDWGRHLAELEASQDAKRGA
jgi:hypothetical protein